MKQMLLICVGFFLLCGISSADCTPAPLTSKMTISAATNFPKGTSDTFTVTSITTGCFVGETRFQICIYQEAHREVLLGCSFSFPLYSETPISAVITASVTLPTKKLDKSKPTSYATAYLFSEDKSLVANAVTDRGAPLWF